MEAEYKWMLWKNSSLSITYAGISESLKTLKETFCTYSRGHRGVIDEFGHGTILCSELFITMKLGAEMRLRFLKQS